MHKRIFITTPIICFSLILVLIGCTNKEATNNKKTPDSEMSRQVKEKDPAKKTHEEIMKVVESIQRHMPSKSGDIQYEKVEFIPDKDLYFYIINLNKSAVKADKKAIEDGKAVLVKEVRRGKNWTVFRKHSLTIHFKFHDKEMKELYEIVVTPEDYK